MTKSSFFFQELLVGVGPGSSTASQVQWYGRRSSQCLEWLLLLACGLAPFEKTSGCHRERQNRRHVRLGCRPSRHVPKEVKTFGINIDINKCLSSNSLLFSRHYFKLWLPLAILLPTIVSAYISGESLFKCFMCWVGFRLFLSLNFTWFVNSWAHLYGTKPFDK